MTQHTLSTLLLSAALAFALPGAHTQAAGVKDTKIKKCQDAKGRWHYGDNADELCRQSKVVEINQQGLTTREIAAPLSAQELKQRENNKAALEAEAKKAEEQARQDKLLLSTYGHEDDISFVRDRKIADTTAQIQSSQTTLMALAKSQKRLQAQAAEEQQGGKPVSELTARQLANTEGQIAKHQEYVAAKQKEIEAIRQQAAKDTERYRHLKSAAGTPAPAAP